MSFIFTLVEACRLLCLRFIWNWYTLRKVWWATTFLCWKSFSFGMDFALLIFGRCLPTPVALHDYLTVRTQSPCMLICLSTELIHRICTWVQNLLHSSFPYIQTLQTKKGEFMLLQKWWWDGEKGLPFKSPSVPTSLLSSPLDFVLFHLFSLMCLCNSPPSDSQTQTHLTWSDSSLI